MTINLLTSDSRVTNISKSFAYKMAAKTSWHGTKLRHCHPMYSYSYCQAVLFDQLRNHSTRPTGELWRRAVDRGHGGATTRWPSPATRPWWSWWWWWCSVKFVSRPLGHTTDVLSPFISVLCHSDWRFHGESCPRLDICDTRSSMLCTSCLKLTTANCSQ